MLRPLPRDRAFSAIPATLLLVAIAMVLAVGVWVWSEGFEERRAAEAVGVFARPDGCHPRFVVTGVNSPVDLTHVRLQPSEPGPGYALVMGGRVAVDEPWRGTPPPDFLTGGATIDIWAQAGRAFLLVDDRAGHQLAVMRAPVPPQDNTAPQATLDGPAIITPGASILTGNATDAACGGVARVRVTLTDTVSGLAIEVPTVLGSPGATHSPWTADLAEAPLDPARTYAVALQPRDLAGNVG